MIPYLKALGALMIMVGLPTALLDMGMNGSRGANWAPWGFGMVAVGIFLVEA